MSDDLTLRIDLDSPTPAYRQIVDALRAAMVEGRLRAGARLPTVRQLAVDLSLHHNTVAQAYRELADEGWLDLRRKRGATVLERVANPSPSPETQKQFGWRVRELVAKAQADGMPPASIAESLEGILQQMRQQLC